MNGAVRSLLVLVIAAVAPACDGAGGSDASTDGAVDESVDGTLASEASTDGMALDGDDAMAAQGFGLVSVVQHGSPAASAFGSSVTANFYTGFDPNGLCTYSPPIGACDIATCASNIVSAGVDAGAATLQSAGTVTITGLGAAAMVLTPGARNEYAAIQGNEQLFFGGEVVRFAAAGATGGVPAFSAMLTAPSPITPTAPALPASGTVIPRASDLSVTWNGTGAGQVFVILASLMPSGARDVVICRFPSAPGAATVPTSVLSHLSAGMGSVQIDAANETVVAAGVYQITVAFSHNAAAGLVTFE